MNANNDLQQPVQLPANQKGGAGWGILAWLVGVPLPIILLAYLLKGCFSN